MDMKELCVSLGADIINPDRKYWLVRTKGGKFFEDFYFQGYIAIGWNNTNIDIADTRDKKEIINDMKNQVYEFYKEEKVPGRPASQIYKFIKEMKKGDIVIVPNADSKYIAFGELTEDNMYIENIDSEDIDIDTLEKALLYNGDETYITESLAEVGCPFSKRRKVRWIREMDRNKLDSSLYALLNSHGTISEANKYAYSIDRELSSFYIKGEKAHLVYKVTTEEDVPAIDLLDFVYKNLEFIDIYNELFDKNISKKDVIMKLNVQSPGPIDLQGAIALIGVIATFGVFLVGGNAKFKKDNEGNVEAEIGSKGLLQQIIELIDKKNLGEKVKRLENELLESKSKLKVKNPNVKPTNLETAATEDNTEN